MWGLGSCPWGPVAEKAWRGGPVRMDRADPRGDCADVTAQWRRTLSGQDPCSHVRAARAHLGDPPRARLPLERRRAAGCQLLAGPLRAAEAAGVCVASPALPAEAKAPRVTMQRNVREVRRLRAFVPHPERKSAQGCSMVLFPYFFSGCKNTMYKAVIQAKVLKSLSSNQAEQLLWSQTSKAFSALSLKMFFLIRCDRDEKR